MCNACENCEHKNKFFPESVLNICGGKNLFEKDCCGFINPEIMRGIFLSVCDEVNHPLVFMQKCHDGCQAAIDATNPRKICEEKKWFDKNLCAGCQNSGNFYENYYRLESNIFYKRLSQFCKYVREVKNVDNYKCGFQRCLFNDAHAAAFFLEKDKLPSNIRDELANGYITSDERREYLEYCCEATKYTEIAMPVKLEDKIVGVLIFGQILKKEHESEHNALVNEVEKYFADDADFKKDKQHFDKDVYDDAGFNQKINDCIQSVEKLENRLKDILAMYRKWYIDEISSDLLNVLPKIQFITESDTGTGLVSTEMTLERYNKFKSNLLTMSKSLCNRMNLSEAICFVPNILPNTVNYPDELYSINSSETKSSLELKFDFKTFRSLNTEVDTIKDKEAINSLIMGIENNPERFKDLSLVLYIASGKSQGVLPIAVLVGYKKHYLQDEDNEKFLEELDSLINKIKDSVYFIASAIVNQYMEMEQRRFIQIMRHELGQSYSGYLTLIDQFEKELYSSVKSISPLLNRNITDRFPVKSSSAETHIKNSRSFAHTTMLRVNGTRYSGGVQIPKKTYFYPYGKFLFKWNYIFLETQRKKHLRFEMPIGDVYSNPEGYPLMYADPDMIEQVVFNLTNNAMKYSHFGSSITLNCRADKIKNQYILEVINYASPLSDEDINSIFNYGYSGKNHSEEGSGLGLYISREIAKRHGGDLTVEQKIVSNFNVPLLQLYTEDMPKNMFSIDMFQAVEAEIKKLQQPKDNDDASEWSRILGTPIPQNPFTPLYIKQNIKKQTAKIKFTFYIPLYKSKNKENNE